MEAATIAGVATQPTLAEKRALKKQRRKQQQRKKRHKSPPPETTAERVSRAQATDDIQELIALSHDEHVDVRLAAVSRMCPCRVLHFIIDEFWARVFEMSTDTDSRVRERVLHIICDGSPHHLESEVTATLEKFNHDEVSFIRRRAHKVLATYSRTGEWNIL